MIQINLLPHREIKRRARQRAFVASTIAAAVLGVIVVLLGHVILQKRLENQQARNQFLKSEIAILDGKIAQIKQLREETESLLARKNVVETLQSNRTETVHLLDELVRQMPDGVHLRTMRQAGTKITLEGYAQSNARVSTLMENLERSPWLAAPELLESKQVTLNNQRLHEFSLDVQLKYDAEQDKQRASATTDPVAIPAVAVDPLKGAARAIPAVTGVQPISASGTATPPSKTATAPSTSGTANTGGAVNPTGNRIQPVSPLLGLPKPSSVRDTVAGALSSAQKRSQP